MPGRPAEQFQEMMSFRRAHGSEASLCEFPIEHVVCSGETIRAEEMLVSVPDGRSVRVLVNATPIPTEGDAVSSVVVTFQDQAPLHEIERLRTEFLGLMGHELREPLAAIRGSALTLLEGEALARAPDLGAADYIVKPFSPTELVPRVHTRAGLDDVRMHDLRHSYASRALALGESLTMIGKLLGHTQVQTTARYAHLARDSIQNAAARITGSIGGNLSSVQGGDKTTRQ